MEHESSSTNHEAGIPLRLARGLGNTLLNPFHLLADFKDFSPSPYAEGTHLKTGVLGVIREIWQEGRDHKDPTL